MTAKIEFSKFMATILSVFLVGAVKAHAASPEASKGEPFKNREAFIQALIDANFNQIFEFQFRKNSNFSVYIAGEDEATGKKTFKKVPYQTLIENEKRWVPVPALDYLFLEGYAFKRAQYMRAYKVGKSLICHVLEGIALDKTTFCVSVPLSVDVVIQRMERLGVINP